MKFIINYQIENSIINNTIIENVDLTNVTFLFTFSNFCKCLLFIVSMFFSLFFIFFSITLDFEISLLNVFVEKTTIKIFRVEIVIEKKFAFVATVFDFLIILSKQIAILNRNAEKKFKMSKIFLQKKDSNDVEQQRFYVFLSSLSFNVLKLNNSKNFDFFDNFFAYSIEQKTTFIEI